jgi:hypothetical protein
MVSVSKVVQGEMHGRGLLRTWGSMMAPWWSCSNSNSKSVREKMVAAEDEAEEQ